MEVVHCEGLQVGAHVPHAQAFTSGAFFAPQAERAPRLNPVPILPKPFFPADATRWRLGLPQARQSR